MPSPSFPHHLIRPCENRFPGAAPIVAAMGSTRENPSRLGLRASQIGLAGPLSLAGAIAGALVFGHLTDRLGRKKLFTVTLGIYLAGAALTACSWDFWSFVLF